MSAIKPGDLVMVVRGNPCCGRSKFQGMVAIVIAEDPNQHGLCALCSTVVENGESAVRLTIKHRGMNVVTTKCRLKKIDPPETGDSLPTRADLNLPEPACQ